MKCTRNLHSYFAERLYNALKVTLPSLVPLVLRLLSGRCQAKALRATAAFDTCVFSNSSLL